jgi:hypothetical protein
MRLLFFTFALCLHLYSCGQKKEVNSNYPAHVGDILFNKETDDTDFKICNEDRVFQYYNLQKGFQYKGEKAEIINHFRIGYKPVDKKSESGYVTIRFIVNCAGETGRFRVEEMDMGYNPKTFDKNITDQLVSLTKKLNGWVKGEHGNMILDYYQYLTFKIEDGKLTEILP